jgi:hypothetical protein
MEQGGLSGSYFLVPVAYALVKEGRVTEDAPFYGSATEGDAGKI